MKKTVPGSFFIVRLVLLVSLLSNGIVCYSQNIDFGKSYINITKGLNGGTVENGDILEIRASFVVRSGTYDSCRYMDAIPGGTVFLTGTIRVLTNEGKIYKQFTDVPGDDAGWRSGSNITINLGFNTTAAPATAFRRGRVANTHKPSFYNSACIMIASYRVRVTAAMGSNISTGGGNMTYKSGALPVQTFTFPSNLVRVYPNYGICANTIGANSIGTEFNGTFGSGQPRNRGASANVPVGYAYQIFTTNAPNDYTYGVANNTSARTAYTTLNTWPKPDPDPDGAGPLTTHRVFSVWDIIGDHTGAASQTAGNPAADTVANINAGYMLVINAAYRIDSAFQQTISGLCPNTYYEISCWMRNICSKCGCDSNGRGATNSAGPPFYIPSAPGDSSGVRPNLTFEVDGIDYYTTGDLAYTGEWVKKGFTFLTGATQTSFTLKFFNNAPGGGGNDWALDDISVSTCSPDMRYSPTLNPTVCDSNIIVLSDTIRSFFNNYVYHKWQRSTDGGLTWTDVTPATGPATPFWNGTAWEYVTSYTVPTTQTMVINNGDLYRVVVATTLANLSNINCRFTDEGNIIALNIIDCGIPLNTQLIAFTGTIADYLAKLEWITTYEDEPFTYEVEKSSDGVNFSRIAILYGFQGHATSENSYSFTDPEPVSGKVYYRVLMKNERGHSGYTKTIQLSLQPEPLAFITVFNPFNHQLVFDVSAGKNEAASAELVDVSGNVVRRINFYVAPGVTRQVITNTTGLPPGIFFLRIKTVGAVIQRSVVKHGE